MIWARDSVALDRAVRSALYDGDASPGDPYLDCIWPHAAPPPRPRWTTLSELEDIELDTVEADLRGLAGKPPRPTPTTVR